MASFCKQCAILMQFHPDGDFKGIAEKGKVIFALCEGCGPVEIDHEGRCVSLDCDPVHGHRNERAEKYLREVEEWQARRKGRLGWLRRSWDRWNGTPWEPGQRHYLRWRWYDTLDRLRSRSGPWDFEG